MADSVSPTLAQATADLVRALTQFQNALANDESAATGPVFEALRKWRTEQARAKQVPPYIIASDAVLRAIEQARPADLMGLRSIRGIGPAKAELYGDGILAVLQQSTSARAF